MYKYIFIAVPNYQANIPDFITITREINSTKPIGVVYIAIKGKTVSSYNIVYRTKKPNDNEKENVIKLQNGLVLKDFINLQVLPTIKFYKYIAGEDNSEKTSTQDIRITLTSEKNEFDLYVFLQDDFWNYSFDTKTLKVRGYTWKANYNNEVIISKYDSKFARFGAYYVLVVFKKSIYNEDNEFSHRGAYYIVATDEEYPIFLHEGFPHAATLDNKFFTNQIYYYNHHNVSIPCKIDVNSYRQIDVEISFNNKFENTKFSANNQVICLVICLGLVFNYS
jgi:hypothetical protein